MTDNEIIKEATRAVNENLNASCYVGDLLRIIELQRAEIAILNMRYADACERIKQLTGDIKEFTERVIDLMYGADDANPVSKGQFINLVKEMAGGDDEQIQQD